MRLAEELATFISVEHARALVTAGELGRYREVHDIVLPEFDKEYPEACVIEGEEVLTLRPEERGTQKLFVNTKQIPRGIWGPPLMEEDWVVLCQALYQSIGEEERFGMHFLEVRMAGRVINGLDNLAWRKLLETWKVHTHKALRICEDRQFQVETSEVSYVSFERVEVLWPSSLIFSF